MSPKVETVETRGEGNTKPHPAREVQKKFFCFTFFHHNLKENKMDISEIKSLLSKHFKRYLWGEEICPKTGKEHYQGFGELKKRMRWSALKKVLPSFFNFRACIASEEANEEYCIKEGRTIFKFGYPKDLKIIEKLLPWQEEIMNIYTNDVKNYNDRCIHWIIDNVGNSGKTQLCKYAAAKHKAIIATAGNSKDIANLIKNQIEAGNDIDEETLFLFNITRSNNNISYNAIEAVKDGLITNIKYEANTYIFNSPVVMIFSNEEPDLKKLSADRWKIYSIDADKKLIHLDPLTFKGQIKK